MSLEPLEPLVFGDRGAKALSTPDEVHNFLKVGSRAIRDASFVGPIIRFKASSLQLPQLKILASVADPFLIKFWYNTGDVPIVVPISGSGGVICNGHEEKWAARHSLILNEYEGEQTYYFSEQRSLLYLLLDATRLEHTLAAMRGEATANDIKVRSEDTRVLSLERSENFRSLIGTALSLTDMPGNDEDYLRTIGFDDVIFRIVANMYTNVLHDHDVSSEPSKKKRSWKAVTIVCEYIASNTSRLATLTEMERMSGMTSRSLNNAFNERFGLSPQAWQRNYRLDQARKEIQKSDTASVKAIARQFGFISPSSFSSFYKRRFGELPSQTVWHHHGNGSSSRQSAAPETSGDKSK